MKPRYICIHGHFYQPPRENPVTGRIDPQPSAQPFRDWNEKIYHECYAPNSVSRLLDDLGRIRNLFNNYDYMSFDFGPTLLSWMQTNHPDTYELIIQADKNSRKRLDGCGNALAQSYNHSILPLGNPQDRKLQIAWGIKDFEIRYGRKPEGMWLPESAINNDTVRELINQGIQFTVLSPTQAQSVRNLKGGKWEKVDNGSIDVTQPYRIFPGFPDEKPGKKNYLDVFFYDGQVSHAIGFQHLLTSAEKFGNAIVNRHKECGNDSGLLSVATDGESYGHHEPFADMCASYFFNHLATDYGLTPVNYCWYLKKFPPTREVTLKNADSEGSAWSCAHGTGRWIRDCGCSTGGQKGWNQKWRGPLRSAMNILRDKSQALLDQKGPEVFRDWESAQMEAPEGWQEEFRKRNNWLEKNLLHSANRLQAEKILEILRFTQYTYTSCAWFFSEVSGIEARQNLRYVVYTIDCLKQLYHEQRNDITSNLETLVLNELKKARSNNQNQTGLDIYNQEKKSLQPLWLHLAMNQWLNEYPVGKNFHQFPIEWSFYQKQEELIGAGRLFRFQFQKESTGEFFRVGAAETGSLPKVKICFFGPHPDGDLAAEKWLKNETQGLLALQKVGGIEFEPEFLPAYVRKHLADCLFWGYLLEEAPGMERQFKQLGQVASGYQSLEVSLPLLFNQVLERSEKQLFLARLAGVIETTTPENLSQCLEKAMELSEKNQLPDLTPFHEPLGILLENFGVQWLQEPKEDIRQNLFLLLSLVDRLGLGRLRTKLENKAFPLFKSLSNGSIESFQMMDSEMAIKFLQRLNFSLEGAERMVFAKNP